jgi:hypothetical protein
MGSGELSEVGVPVRGSMSNRSRNGSLGFVGEASLIMVPSGFRFFLGLPSLEPVRELECLDSHSIIIPHRGRIVAAYSHVGASMTVWPDLIALDLGPGTCIT